MKLKLDDKTGLCYNDIEGSNLVGQLRSQSPLFGSRCIPLIKREVQNHDEHNRVPHPLPHHGYGERSRSSVWGFTRLRPQTLPDKIRYTIISSRKWLVNVDTLAEYFTQGDPVEQEPQVVNGVRRIIS